MKREGIKTASKYLIVVGLYLIVVGGGAQIANFGKKTSVLYGAIDS